MVKKGDDRLEREHKQEKDKPDKAEPQGSQRVELLEQDKLGEVETYKIYIF
jgi:hypothetical protein